MMNWKTLALIAAAVYAGIVVGKKNLTPWLPTP